MMMNNQLANGNGKLFSGQGVRKIRFQDPTKPEIDPVPPGPEPGKKPSTDPDPDPTKVPQRQPGILPDPDPTKVPEQDPTHPDPRIPDPSRRPPMAD